jgi:hypothetical protein
MMDCETFIDVFIILCVIVGLGLYFHKQGNKSTFVQTTNIRGFGTGGNPQNPGELGLVASNFSGGGVQLPVEYYTSYTNPYNSRRELTLKQAF